MKNSETINVDALIVGGGIAGLWTHARLVKAGYKSLLIESEKLGAGQTRYAQGIIHGGTKYALTGKLSASAKAVADMPSRWKNCYLGKGEIDLTAANLLSEAHYLWANNNISSRLSSFFASKIMQSRSTEIAKHALPKLFQHKNFQGKFYRLDEPIFDTLSVIKAIAKRHEKSILQIDKKTITHEDNAITVISKQNTNYKINYKKIIFMAGEGNQQLLKTIKLAQPKMQLRPLKMVVLRGNLTDNIYAHNLGVSANPRITITSHRDNKNNIVWYLGGQLAEHGINQNNTDLIKMAKNELTQLIPWLSLKDKQWGVLVINRAELKYKKGQRPTSFALEQTKNIITAWPTKMALAPLLADEVINQMRAVEKTTNTALLPNWASPTYADYPWNNKACWMNNEEVENAKT